MRNVAKRSLSIALVAALAIIANTKATLANDAEDCASTTIGAGRSAAACLRLANQGEAWAQFNLGNMYENGEGMSQNLQQAANWYRKAGEQGYAYAQYNLGVLYDSGRGVPQDDKEAVKWYRKAAEQGLAHAMGEGVPQDDTEALKWFRLAAEQGSASAQDSLGYMYEHGLGVSRNYQEAVKWYRKAAEQGDARGKANLGSMYELGRGVERDDVQAYLWYDLAAVTFPPGQERDEAVERRDIVASKMTADQIEEAQRMARQWKQKRNP